MLCEPDPKEKLVCLFGFSYGRCTEKNKLFLKINCLSG